MTLVATRPTLEGDLVKHEYGRGHGYERVMKTVTTTLADPVGTVYFSDNGAQPVVITAALMAGYVAAEDTIYLLVDDAPIREALAAGTNTVACIEGGAGGSGALIVSSTAFYVADAAWDNGDTVETDLITTALANQGIKVVQSI